MDHDFTPTVAAYVAANARLDPADMLAALEIA